MGWYCKKALSGVGSREQGALYLLKPSRALCPGRQRQLSPGWHGLSRMFLHSALSEPIPQYCRAPETHQLCFRSERLMSSWDFICCISYCFTRRFGLWFCSLICRTGNLLSPSWGPGRTPWEDFLCRTCTELLVQNLLCRTSCSPLFTNSQPSSAGGAKHHSRSTEATQCHRGLTAPSSGQELSLLTRGTEPGRRFPDLTENGYGKFRFPQGHAAVLGSQKYLASYWLPATSM